MRLLDLLLAERFETNVPVNKDLIYRNLSHSEMVIIDNVADYYFSQMKLEEILT